MEVANNDPDLYADIKKAFDDGQVVRVLSRVDPDGNVQTYELDAEGKEIGPWPR